MKAYVEIRLRLTLDNGATLQSVISQFAKKTKGWTHAAQWSDDYQIGIGRPAVVAVASAVKGLKPAGVAIASDNERAKDRFHVTNIVPLKPSWLTMNEYNAIGMAFASSFRAFLRAGKIRGQVELQAEEKHLSDIITAAKCRQFFDQYLLQPTSHPLDIQHLDVFICALMRYSAKVDSNEIERYLVMDCGWKREKAAWVKQRIDTGLDILKVDRTF